MLSWINKNTWSSGDGLDPYEALYLILLVPFLDFLLFPLTLCRQIIKPDMGKVAQNREIINANILVGIPEIFPV